MESAYPDPLQWVWENKLKREGKPTMLYLGLDVHSKWMTIKGFNPETGETIFLNRVGNDPTSLRLAFESLGGCLHGAMESGTNAWAVYRDLEKYFERLLVVDPATVWGKDVRRGAKTDGRDAMGLALKLSRGELQGLYVPDRQTQDLRSLGRAKVQATQRVTKLVNEIGSLLRSWGVIVDCSLLTQKGQALIEKVKPQLPENSLMVLDMWIEMLAKAQEIEKKLDTAIEQQAGRDETCKQLMSIPGVGPFTALVVRAEVGDIDRFATASSLICYCGLSPTTFRSADKEYHGKLNKFCNRYLKYALMLRGQGAGRQRTDNVFKRTYWRVTIKQHVNDAKVAVARQMTRVMFKMLKSGEVWNPSKGAVNAAPVKA
jgi:transposase